MRRVLPLIAMLLLGFAPATFPKSNPAKDDLKAMQGCWECLKYQYDGGDAPIGSYYMKIAGEKVSFADKRLLWTRGWALKVDATKKPRRFTIDDMRGIYKIEGDILTLCFVNVRENTEYPADFASPLESKRHFEVWKRQKP